MRRLRKTTVVFRSRTEIISTLIAASCNLNIEIRQFTNIIHQKGILHKNMSVVLGILRIKLNTYLEYSSLPPQ